MYTTKTLKTELQRLAQNNYQPDPGLNLMSLVEGMLTHIGDVDEILRDNLIYTTFATWILDHQQLTPEQMEAILMKVLGENHLFYGLGETETDSVFTRSFSVLLLPLILIAHRRNPFLEPEMIIKAKTTLMAYAPAEKDRRGYVPGKGWAHAIAHTADALDDLAQCQELDEADLLDLLALIGDLSREPRLAYAHAEEERLIIPVIAIINRNILSLTQLRDWIRSFAPPILAVTEIPEKLVIRTNAKAFLQSLYFQFRWKALNALLTKSIEETLQSISLFK